MGLFETIPRGPEWNKLALFMPENAVPFQRSAHQVGLAPGAIVPLIDERVRVDVNGLRIERIYWTAYAGGNIPAGLLRNGSPADPALYGRFFVAQSIVASGWDVIDCFATYEQGDRIGFQLDNTGGGGSAGDVFSLFLKGWYF